MTDFYQYLSYFLDNFALILIILFLFIVFRKGVFTVPQEKAYLVERFGKYRVTLNSGLNFIIPFLDNLVRNPNGSIRAIDLREKQIILAGEKGKIELNTKDNVEVEAEISIFYRIVDPAKSEYRVDNIESFVRSTVLGILRDVAGRQTLDEIQSNRKEINDTMVDTLKETTQEWGINFTRTEITDIDVDEETKTAQRQELTAERKRRAMVLEAEGKKKEIELEADATLYKAQKEADAKKIAADADAYAIQKQGEAITNNGQAAVSFEVLKKQVQAISEVAKSQNSKTVILPTDITKVLGSFETVLSSLKAK